MTLAPHVLLFSPATYGHHSDSIRYQIEHWQRNQYPGRLTYVVSPHFVTVHADLVATVADDESINFCSMSEQEAQSIETGLPEGQTIVDLLRGVILPEYRARREWEIFCRYARQEEADHAILLFADPMVPALMAHLPAPCPFYLLQYSFPLLHEEHLARVGVSLPLPNKAEKMQSLFLFKRMLEHPQLVKLLTHDFHAIERLGHLVPRKMRFLPERAPQVSTANRAVANLKIDLGVETGRMIFLIFGALAKRKGIEQVMQALTLLPKAVAEEITLLIVGRISTQDYSLIEKAIGAYQGAVQVILRQEFVPEEEVLTYFCLADVIVAAYPRHLGSSGILVNAAMAQRPVLSSNFGLMGLMVERYGLGITVDAVDPAAIARGIVRFLREPQMELYDPSQMRVLAEESTPDRYAAALFAELFSPHAEEQ